MTLEPLSRRLLAIADRMAHAAHGRRNLQDVQTLTEAAVRLERIETALDSALVDELRWLAAGTSPRMHRAMNSAADRLALLEADRVAAHAEPRPGSCQACGVEPGGEHDHDCPAYLAIMRAGAEAEQPRTRRFLVEWRHEHFGVPPTRGYVTTGPARAVWRVLEVEVHRGTLRYYTVEPVDPHDVPVDAEVRELPLPIRDVTDGER